MHFSSSLRIFSISVPVLYKRSATAALSISTPSFVAPFIAGKYMDQAARFKRSVLRRALEDCVKAEEDVKTGKVGDVMSVELLMIKYSSIA